ncbi:MAG: DUF4058 family protein [Rhodopirellula sp.]|nr:DUF4058 family protein [Rhodopirellula sp.]
MPSPFPGMDPYLEAPDIWPDLHDRLANQISAVLNSVLPAPYYARLEMRPEVGIVEEGLAIRRIVPDVAVVRRPPQQPAVGGTAVLDLPRDTISNSLELEIPVDPIRHGFVEIRDPSRGHQLITLIEIVSPSNKRAGPDRQMYLRKQREVLESDASLIEVDLHRTGQRLLIYRELEQLLEQIEPRPDYLVLVNRAWRRQEGATAYQIFPVMVTEILPCIPVPLRQGQDEIPLDLQFVFSLAYDGGPYRRGAVDYTQPPRLPLPSELASWVDDCVRRAFQPKTAK